MAKKIPSNFYQEVNVRKLNNVFDSGLPSIGSDDNGKVVKVVENKFALSEDLHTTVVANPEGSSTDELQTLKVGDTIYAVNKPSFDTIKAFKITIANGGQYNTNKPIIEFYDDGGNKANITSSDYTVVCDKTYAGNATMTEVCSIQTPETPGTFTYTFVNDFNTLKYHIMKLKRGGTFLNDIAKNIKIELSVDGTNFISIYDETSITWSDAVTSHLIDLATGEEASTLLPIVTNADNGKVLTVVNGIWDKSDITDRYDHIDISLRTPLSLTITPEDPGDDDPYELFELTFGKYFANGYNNNGNSTDIKTLLNGNGVKISPNTSLNIHDNLNDFVFMSPICDATSNFKLSNIGSTVWKNRPFACHIPYNSMLGISTPYNGIAYIDSITSNKLTFKLFKV